MAFKPLRPVGFNDLKSAIIANSQTIAIGDAIVNAATTHAAFVTEATTITGVCGVVTSIVGLNGKVLEKTSVTVASNNETVGMIGVQYIPTYIPMEYMADINAVAGTTIGSNLPGMFSIDIATAGFLNESTYTVYTTVKQFYSYGKNPLNSSQVIGHWTSAVGQV